MTEHITSRKNPLIQQVRRLLGSRKERQSAGLFVSDGTKLLEEAVRWWPGLQTVICTQEVNIQLPQQVQKVTVPKDIMEYISPMQAPQGALFICRLPEEKPLEVRAGMLILDGIQDPGNLGTILRTADALSVPVVLLEGCADPYSHKVVRSSMGAVLRCVPGVTTWEQVKTLCQEKNIPVAVTALSEEAKDIRDATLKNMAVVIGSEGQGVRPEIMDYAKVKLIIPMNENCESLNAAIAAAIAMWEMKK